MEPHGPHNSQNGDVAGAPPVRLHEQGLAPASSLTSIHVRRRAPPRNKAPAAPSGAPNRVPRGMLALPATRAADPPALSAESTDAPEPRVPSLTTAAAVDDAPADPAPTAPVPRLAPDIGRAARRVEAKPRLAMPDTRPPAPKPAESRRDPDPPEMKVGSPEGIVSYWLRLRGSRRIPAMADLDQGRIATDWPNSILMRCRAGSKVLEPEKVFAQPTQPSADPASGNRQAAMELSPMMLQWLLTLAGEAARDRRPMQDTEAFPSRNQSISYDAFALPFGDNPAFVDHVLCHVYRAAGPNG